MTYREALYEEALVAAQGYIDWLERGDNAGALSAALHRYKGAVENLRAYQDA